MKRFLLLILFFSLSAQATLTPLLGGNTLGLSCSDGQVPEWNGTGFTQCLTASGSGTVTSVGALTDSTTSGIFANTANAISGSPVTAAGSFTFTFKTQSANTFLAGPTTGSAAAPTYRLLVIADLPTVTVAKGGTNATSLTAHGALVSNSGGTAVTTVAPGTSGNVLTSNGTDWTSAAAASSGVTTVGSFSGSSQTNGASISGSTITFGPADGTNPGMVSTGAQTIAGDKTLTGVTTMSGASSQCVSNTNIGSALHPLYGFDDGSGDFSGMYTDNAYAIHFSCSSVNSSCAVLNSANGLGVNGNWFFTDANTAGNKDTAFFSNQTNDTVLFTSSNNPDTTDAAGMKMYGKTHATPSITEFWNAGVLTAKFDASNHAFFPNLAVTSSAQTGTVCSGVNGEFTVDTTTTCLASTREIKKDEDPLDVGLDLVSKLRPVSYSLREDHGEGRQIGLIAEDVAEVEPRLVALDANGDPRAVRYQQLTAVLVKAMQELLGITKNQQKEIVDLKAQVKSLQYPGYEIDPGFYQQLAK